MGPWAHHWYLNLGFTLALGFSIAYLSWHYIEKPALALRRFLPTLEKRAVSLIVRKPQRSPQDVADVHVT
jgi:peptidoglycan/LPS O-acetylase OafA/YrhL